MNSSTLHGTALHNALDDAFDDARTARQHIHTQGWIDRHSEAFHHLPPPPLSVWLGNDTPQPTPAHDLGWTLHTPNAERVEVHTLDALNNAQRAALFADLPMPANKHDDEAAPFAWAHRMLCRKGLRVRVCAPVTHAAHQAPTVWLTLQHTPHTPAPQAPLLILEIDPGVRCVLLESHGHQTHQTHQTHEATAHVHNLHMHLRLGAGAQLQHLRIVTPTPNDTLAHHLHTHIAAGARYAQALIATGSSYHLQRQNVHLQGAHAQAHHASLLLTNGQRLDQQTYTRIDNIHNHSTVETVALAQGHALAVANAHTRIAAHSAAATVRQRLSGIPISGTPRLVLRPHLEILHDNVQAAHGATWGALPEDALFYARQRGLDERAARMLIIEGMARALLERCLGTDEDGALHQWLNSGALSRAIGSQLPDTVTVHAAHQSHEAHEAHGANR